MSFESDWFDHLNAAAITAIVGTQLGPMIREEGSEPPALTWQIIALNPSNEFDNDDGGLINYRVQVDAWSRTYDQVRTLAEAVRTRLKTAAATFSAIPNPGGGGDLYEQETRTYRVSMDFSVWYSVP